MAFLAFSQVLDGMLAQYGAVESCEQGKYTLKLCRKFVWNIIHHLAPTCTLILHSQLVSPFYYNPAIFFFFFYGSFIMQNKSTSLQTLQSSFFLFFFIIVEVKVAHGGKLCHWMCVNWLCCLLPHSKHWHRDCSSQCSICSQGPGQAVSIHTHGLLTFISSSSISSLTWICWRFTLYILYWKLY